jgi:hypothetical protein
VCAFAHSRFVENPPIWSWETNPSFLRWFCHSWGLQYRYDFENRSLSVLSKTATTENTGRFVIQNSIFIIWGKPKNRAIFLVYRSVFSRFYLKFKIWMKMFNWSIFLFIARFFYFVFFQNFPNLKKSNRPVFGEPTKLIQTDVFSFCRYCNPWARTLGVFFLMKRLLGDWHIERPQRFD